MLLLFYFKLQFKILCQLKKSNSEEIYSFTVPFSEYKGKFADDQMSMKVESVVTLQGNDDRFTQTMEFQITNQQDAVTVSVSS